MKPLLWDSFILRDFRLTKRYDFAIAGAAYDSKTRSVDTTGISPVPVKYAKSQNINGKACVNLPPRSKEAEA